VNPEVGRGPGERAVSDLIFSRLESIGGLQTRRQDVAEGRANVIAIMKGSGGGRSLMLNGHMDTVGVDGMTVSPFSPFVDKGMLHGRGACDMKGALAAMMGALKSLVHSKAPLRGDLIFSAVIDEEHKSLGMRRLLQECKTDAAVVGEPTEMNLATAHKGFAWIEVETRGKAAHGSVPEKGVDAIAHAAKVVHEVERLARELSTHTHSLLGSAKIHTSKIEGGTDWSIVPQSCVLRLERRTLPGETRTQTMQEVELILQALKREDSSFDAAARCLYDVPPLETSSNEPVVRLLREVIAAAMGGTRADIGVPYWTDGGLLSNSAGIPTCIFGPGDIGVAHSADEYVSLEDVVASAEIYRRVALKFCG
jgi:acetylornithine deacetylase